MGCTQSQQQLKLHRFVKAESVVGGGRRGGGADGRNACWNFEISKSCIVSVCLYCEERVRCVEVCLADGVYSCAHSPYVEFSPSC